MHCIVVWGLSSAVISSLCNSTHPPDISSRDGMWLPMWHCDFFKQQSHTQSSQNGMHLSVYNCMDWVTARVFPVQCCNNCQFLLFSDGGGGGDGEGGRCIRRRGEGRCLWGVDAWGEGCVHGREGRCLWGVGVGAWGRGGGVCVYHEGVPTTLPWWRANERCWFLLPRPGMLCSRQQPCRTGDGRRRGAGHRHPPAEPGQPRQSGLHGVQRQQTQRSGLPGQPYLGPQPSTPAAESPGKWCTLLTCWSGLAVALYSALAWR